MKKLTQKLVLSVVTMALVVIALGTSTFAWFTLTNSATVQVFQAQVTSGQGIEVTLGVPNGNGNPYLEPSASPAAPTVWYTVMPSSVITSFINTKYSADFRFTDITTADGVSFSTYNLNNNTSGSATSGWLEIPIYFRSAVQQDIVWNSATLGGTSKVWDVNVATFKHSNGTSYGTDVLGYTKLRVAAWTAARVSITGDVGISVPAATTVVFQEGAVTKDSVLNSTATLASYDFPGAAPYTTGLNALGAASYAVASGKSLSLTALPTIPSTLTAAAGSVLTLTHGAITGFDDYFTGVAVVRVWVEGWDADTYDAIFDTMLTVQLGFGTTAATA